MVLTAAPQGVIRGMAESIRRHLATFSEALAAPSFMISRLNFHIFSDLRVVILSPRFLSAFNIIITSVPVAPAYPSP